MMMENLTLGTMVAVGTQVIRIMVEAEMEMELHGQQVVAIREEVEVIREVEVDPHIIRGGAVQHIHLI
jgi:hypothetical protein